MDVTDDKKRTTIEESDEGCGGSSRDIREKCPCGIEVDLSNYDMLNMGEGSSGMVVDLAEGNVSNFNERNQSVSGQHGESHPQNNPYKDRILGLELIARFQRRKRGFRRLTQIHGVSMLNETEDICPRRSLKKEIIEELVGNSQPKENKAEKVVINEEVIPVEREARIPDTVNANVEKEQSYSARTIRARRREQQKQEKTTVLSWMVDRKVIKPRERVFYMDHERKCVLLSGEIDGGEIWCECCSKSVSISEFEAHSKSKICDPLKNICVKGGLSLLQCLTQAWNMQDEYACNFYHFFSGVDGDQRDDICGICGDEGEQQICCDGCSSVFHQTCLGLERVQSGVWYCMYCRCKFCGLYGEKQKDSSGGFVQSLMSACRTCGEKYHKSCLEASGANPDHSKLELLCGNECKVVYERLENMLGKKYAIEDGFTWSLIRRSDVDSNTSQVEPGKVESNCKLGVAYSVLKDCFSVHTDEISGVNMMRSILYNCGSNFPRVNFERFFTAILEKGDEIISVATIRIHGNQVAEMSYVGTLSLHRKKGMFSRLMKGIVSALSFLNVELLIISSMLQVKNTWIRSFGFEPLDLRSKKLIKSMNLMVFPGTVTLQKKIPKQ
ncbi:increased DNA methylation 1-like [Cajanus cajan]|uniref:increased DNA methylation 1-like n=1 Tax=Cajanus cajan TaxID=3821 RepID=UPI00098DC7F7|nr:increased DNA methylation 1-like [Cajanus cajan]